MITIQKVTGNVQSVLQCSDIYVAYYLAQSDFGSRQPGTRNTRLTLIPSVTPNSN
jgi:hypothetical protein